MKTQIGTKFGDLTVIEDAGMNKHAHRTLRCLCACGKEKIIEAGSLLKGATRSCGCKRAENIGKANTRHGLYGSRINIIWRGMLQRCKNKNHSTYCNYGGRGISVCAEWEDFSTFMQDMGLPPSIHHSIDRIDVNGNYEPNNCRWATSIEQGNNTTKNRIIDIEGVTHTLQEWCRIFDQKYDRARMRLNMGFSPIKALTRPCGPQGARPGRTVVA